MEDSLNKNTDREKAFIKLQQQQSAYYGEIAKTEQRQWEIYFARGFAELAKKFYPGLKLHDFNTDEVKELLGVVYKLVRRRAFLATMLLASLPIVGWIIALEYYRRNPSFCYAAESSIEFARAYRILAKKCSMSEMADIIRAKV